VKELPLFDRAGPFTSTGGECCHHVDLDLSIVDIAGPSQNNGVEPHELHEAHCGALLTTRMLVVPSVAHLVTQRHFRCGRRDLPERVAWLKKHSVLPGDRLYRA
jgi:hypothetical protein